MLGGEILKIFIAYRCLKFNDYSRNRGDGVILKLGWRRQ